MGKTSVLFHGVTVGELTAFYTISGLCDSGTELCYVSIHWAMSVAVALLYTVLPCVVAVVLC